jgi:glycosyltransferase involved in cell wall biosynthesis
MRILYCNKYNFRFSGTEAYLFDLMEVMRGQGHETALFSMADTRGERSEYERYFVRPLNFKDVTAGWARKVRLAAHAVYSREARSKLGRMIAEFRPEVAHVRNIYHHLSPSIFWELRRNRVPVIYHLNDFKMLCPNYNFIARGAPCERCGDGSYWKAVAEGCYAGGRGAASVLAGEAYVHRWLRTYERCVDLFLVPSEFVKHKLVEHGGPANRIEVLPHFQRVAEYANAPSPDAPVLYAGRLSAEKGLEHLLRAMAQLRGIPLVLAGEGPMRGALERLRDTLGLDHVTFAGHLQEEGLAQAYRECCFTVFPSLAYETLGKSILESYSWGRAVVASDRGSRREFVRQGETGLLYSPGSANELAESIAFLCRHPRVNIAMGQAGQKLLRESYTPEQHYASLMGLYQRVSSGRVPRADHLPKAQEDGLRVAFIGGRGVVGKYSGIEAYYEEVGARLAAHGHDVTVYCRPHFTPETSEHEGMRVVRIPTIRTQHLETLIHTLLSSLHALRQNYDVVHYHALGPALFAWIPRLAGIKTAVTVQGLDWRRKKWSAFAASVLRLGERAAVRCPNSTMVVSQVLREHYARAYRAATLYVPNGAVAIERREPRQILDWGLRPEQYILYLGRFSREKNCHLLMRAFEQAGLSCQLVLAGGAGYADAYAQELRQHASEQVRLLDYVAGDALAELLTNAMLFVLPSDLEGLSLALLEAMGAGRCVLVSDIPENREAVGDAGFFFRRGDVEDLARQLRFLASSPEIQTAMGQRAKERVATLYGWDDITKAIEGEYYRITAKEPSLMRDSKRGSTEARGKGQAA